MLHLGNFEYYFANMWNQHNCAVVWTFLTLPFFGTGMKTDLFQSCGHCWVFQICWHIEGSTFTASFVFYGRSIPPLSIFLISHKGMGFPGGSVVNNPPANARAAGDAGWSLGQEDPLEAEMATHSSILARIIPWTEEPGGLQSMGSQRVRHDWATELYQTEQKQKILRRGGKNTLKNCTKNLHDLDNHNGVFTHLEPDILECKVKWTLGSITTDKAREMMEFQLSYFKSWKMMLWKCYTQYASKFGKLSSGHRTGKCQFSFQSQRKAMPKNVQTSAQLHSSHTLVT